MRPNSALPTAAAVASTAILLLALIVIAPETVLAADQAPAQSQPPSERQASPSATPSPAAQEQPANPWPVKPRWKQPANRPVIFDDYDQIAALDAIRIALVEVGDGATYVWHRRDGTFSGTAKPTQSFKNRDGQPCRHIVVTLQTSSHARTTEGIACRLVNGRWQLDG